MVSSCVKLAVTLASCQGQEFLSGQHLDNFDEAVDAEAGRHLNNAFDAFIAKYGKEYSSGVRSKEYGIRKEIFKVNTAKIAAHNAKGLTWTLAVNSFADLTMDEFVDQYTGLAADEQRHLQDDPLMGTVDDVNPRHLQDAVDWVEKGAVNSVKNQAGCGTCWAFATVGTVESAVQISTGQLHSLSEQQVIDCDTGNFGCRGGYPSRAYNYMSQAAHCSTDSYPYTAKDQDCVEHESSCSVVLPRGAVTGYRTVPANVNSLKSALQSGPVMVWNEAGLMQLASEGVITAGCEKVDHVVVAVGYGTDVQSGLDYFRIRNSWGSRWGENGYARLSQDGGYLGTACLFRYSPNVPTLATPTTTTTTTTRLTCAVHYSCPDGFEPALETEGDRVGQSPFCSETKGCKRGKCCNRENVIFKHESGLCVHPRGGKAIPEDGTPLVLWNDCSNNLKVRWVVETGPAGFAILKHSSGSCADIVDDKLVFSSICNRIFSFSPSNFLQHRFSDRCVGLVHDSNDAQLVLLPSAVDTAGCQPFYQIVV